MAPLTAVPLRKGGQGFTLIELLLAVSLLSILLAALVFNFTSLQSNPELLNGAERFESLLRYARAQAAYTGCRVQIEFEPEDFDWFGPTLHRVRLAWEPDPWAQPGIFKALPQTAWDLSEINRRVAVEQVTLPGSSLAGPAAGTAAEASWDMEEFLFEDSMASPLPILFLPDGSCESAEILLAARSEDDPRKVKIHLTGLTGTIRREIVSPANLDQAEEQETSEENKDLQPMLSSTPDLPGNTLPAGGIEPEEPTDGVRLE